VPLRPGLLPDHGAGQPSTSRLERIHSNTSDQSLIQRRLLLFCLPAPLANPLDDLQSLLHELSNCWVLSAADIAWIARLEGTEGDHAAVLQLIPTFHVAEVLSRAHRNLRPHSGWELRPWAECELLRFSRAWAPTPSQSVCIDHFVTVDVKAPICKWGVGCRYSHSIGNLHTLQRRAIQAAKDSQPREEASAWSHPRHMGAAGASLSYDGRESFRARRQSRSRSRSRDRHRRSPSPRRRRRTPSPRRSEGKHESRAEATWTVGDHRRGAIGVGHEKLAELEADGRPLFHCTQPLLPGLTFTSSSSSASLQLIDSDTTDQRLIQNRLVLAGLPPLRSDASDAELRADLERITHQLSDSAVIRLHHMLWIARVAPPTGSAMSTSAVIQLNPYRPLMVAAFCRRWAGASGRG
jgi:hypothetical protein